ncbi:MAG: hypothetical protein EXS22_03340 [Pedosphaera sp.]|nr:hypothetical protein [Pedosphaera sp.]MSU43059.1 hypothetical protein [Pedosphaera sp.]
MKLDNIIEKMLAAAREDRPSDHVPYAFEKRIMARIAEQSATDFWTVWSRALWQSVAPSAAVAVVVAAWLSLSPAQPNRAALDPELEQIALLAVELPAK